jgi:hypothetical protein
MNKKIIGSCVLALALSACGGGPVEYLINFDPLSVSANGDNAILQAATNNGEGVSKGPNASCTNADPQTNTGSTNLKSDTIIIVYQGDDQKYYADFNSHVVSGTKNGSVYNLQDSTTRDDTTINNAETKSSDVVTVTMTENGALISGTWKEETHSECDGSSCGNTPIVDCIYSTNFRGQKLPDNGAIAAEPQAGGKG